jgi:hypothetical protein
VLPLIHQYIEDGNNPDQPGRLVQWLYPRVPFYVWKVPGLWYDVGSIETLEEANRVFSREPNGMTNGLFTYTLTNSYGFEVSVTNYGGAVTSLKAPDRDGNFGEIVLGFETLDEYVRCPRYFGALIGRHANRIAAWTLHPRRS